jgi:hypothetical protein
MNELINQSIKPSARYNGRYHHAMALPKLTVCNLLKYQARQDQSKKPNRHWEGLRLRLLRCLPTGVVIALITVLLVVLARIMDESTGQYWMWIFELFSSRLRAMDLDAGSALHASSNDYQSRRLSGWSCLAFRRRLTARTGASSWRYILLIPQMKEGLEDAGGARQNIFGRVSPAI